MNHNVAKGDISDTNLLECSTGRKRIQQASRASFAWGLARLILLLGADIDGPPDWGVDCDVFVEDV